MPGSTGASSVEQTKAKVTESSATNGIFVRPVAVAGIFRPAEESASKPPVLPEKRRFSTLSGDLRPCSGASNDDFARRRQSWDKKPNELPFGQALLRKTPRNSNVSSSSQDLATNGSSHEDISRDDERSFRAPEEKSLENLNSKSEFSTSNNTPISNLSDSSKEIAPVSDGTKLGKTKTAVHANEDEKKVENIILRVRKRNTVSNETAAVSCVKDATDSVVVNSAHKISVTEKLAVSNSLTSETEDKTSNSIDSSKQPKKVYGIRKRETKPEITSPKSENPVPSESKSESDSVKIEKSFVKEESQCEISSKTENLSEKAVVNTLDSSKTKTKVYGVNKASFKKDVKDSEINITRPPEINVANKPAESSVISKTSGSSTIIVSKPSETKVVSKPIESNVTNKISEVKVVNKQSEINIVTNKVVSKSSEINVTNKASDIKAVNKLETNIWSKPSESKIVNKRQETTIASKPFESKSVIKSLETNILSKPSESKIVNKPLETNIVSKPPESKTVNKPLETNIVSKPSESKIVNKPLETNILSKIVNKPLETNIVSKLVNKPLETNIVSKPSESKIVNKPLEANIVSKPPESKVVLKPVEPNAASKTSEIKIVNKAPGINTVGKTFETKVVNKSLETSIASKTSESKVTNSEANITLETKVVNKSSETVSKESSAKVVNKSSEIDTASKTSDIKSVNKLSETPSIASKEVLDSKSADSKATVGITKVGGKANEFQKAQSPPKDFRTLRRTSDVIAARIQNIFSNISNREKSPPLLSKKSKTLDKSNAISDTSSVKEIKVSVENKSVDSSKVEVQQPVKQTDENQTTSCNKSEFKFSAESKLDAKSTSKVVAKKPLVIDQEVKNDIKRAEGDSNKECKYKEQTPSVADHSSLKKENKLASESSDVLQSCKVGEVVNVPKVKTETQLKKADSKTEHSINVGPSKAQDKKNLNIGGKMPIKKQDQKSLDGTASLKATNQDDRKSSDSTTPLKTVMENTNKGFILKTESNNTCVGSGEKVSKSVSSAYTQNISVNPTVDLKNNYNVSRKVESTVSVKEFSGSKSAVVPSTTVNTNTIQQTGTIACVSEISQSHVNEGKKVLHRIVTSSVETTESANIEIAKITPSTVPSPVPTLNVLFRTKSPQGSATKEENRKKVVVETYSSTSPVPSAVINASKVSEKIPVQTSSNAYGPVHEALKTAESVQKSLPSPKLPTKHAIVNLKKEHVATVNLAATDSTAGETSMPPSTVKVHDKNSSVNIGKIETPVSVEKARVSTPIHTDKDKFVATATSLNSDTLKRVRSPGSEIGGKVDLKTKYNEKFFISETDIPSLDSDFEMDKSFISKVNVVDLNDWSRKFQRAEPEPPRVPLRRRGARESMSVRDSMPPALPIRSRFGSLKRIDDSPRYMPRSPSQSSLPQRYSYTEMLSKVCSMGVLPYSEPLTPKSCSSSSSQVSELWSELSEEQSNATHTSEMLESETTERMRLEKEVQELQNRCSQVQIRSDKMEMEMMEARVYRTPELNGDLSEDEDVEANSSLYKQKYERAVRDMEIMKRRIQQQHEEEMEQKAMLKKASDKRLAEALEDVEEERQVANQWKRKAQKLGSELQDLRLMLEEQMARNGELEKKQRRFDAELSAAQEEIKKERLLREKFTREKDQALHEKYSIEQDLQSSRLDADTLHEKITQLNRELDELTLSSKGEEEVTLLKRAKQELERKSRDQEEELEELAAQAGMLEQAKLRLEMSLEKVRQEHRREASVREEEIEEIRACFSKKIKNLEAQLESEQDERHQLMKQKHELERRLYEIADQPPPHDPEIERRLRRDLKRTKALLRDAQSMLEHTREGQSGKTLIRQLKNQLEDSEFAKSAAVKARQAVETELHDCQTQLEESTRVKNEVETRCLQLSREKSAIQTQLEEAEEEMAEVMKKYKAVVAQMSIDQKALSEQNQQIADLETERQMLKDQLSEVSHKFEHLAGQSEDTHKVHRLDGKVRDLESKLELEQTTRSRLEHQIARLKEQNERAREECDSLRNKELQAQEGVRRLQRQMRDLREDYSSLQQKEAEAYRKQHELEMALENTETDLQVTKNDLRLACQRIQDLQNALEDDLDSGTDVPDDSGSDSDDSFELSVLRNQSVTPTQRCDSAASNYSLASEGFRSRTSSFTHELSAFSRMMLSRRTPLDFLG